jgi:hypothetical protein
MTLSHDMPFAPDPDLEEVAAELERGRPVPTPEEAGRIHARVGVPGRRRRSPARARIAIASVLASGMILSGGGAALALSGESGSGNVAAAGYTSSTQVQPQVLGETQGSNSTPQVLGETQGTTPSSGTSAGQVQGTRQVSSSGTKSLPFTGLAAIPIILAGIAMLGTGAWLRRRLLTNN